MLRNSAKAIAAMGMAWAAAMAAPAHAQFSAGYEFLKAVDDRDGQAVTEALSEPGSTVINARDITSGRTALHIVVERRDTTWLQFLLQEGANPNLRDSRGIVPLERAVALRFYDGVEILVKSGANLNETDETGATPLITATLMRDEAMAKTLLGAGADPDKADSTGRSARDYASSDGRVNPVLALIEQADGEGENAESYGPSL